MKKLLDAIKKTVHILDSVSYENYSYGKDKNYLEYIKGFRADEDKLISPILLRKFLKVILGFELGKTIATQESRGVGKPDYIPLDIRTHPFVFDVKGTDTPDLSHHYPQIKRYIDSKGLKYGILTNMRDLDVYTSEKGIEVEEYNFNFVRLYQDYKENAKTCLQKDNTKIFSNFVEDFSYKPLTRKEKIERIAKAKPWTGKEELNIKALTDQLRHVVNILHNDVKEKKSELVNMADFGGVSEEDIANEIEEISSHISGREIEEVNEETFTEVMNADESTIYGKARNAFFRRVANFAMTRLLLARVWEDIDFIGQSLYDGGFAKWYENFNFEIKRVLHYAFDLSAEQYPWLFNVKNNYSWYEPSDDSLIDCLYEFSNFYLGKLDQDILGTIYEDYIERVDKKNKGQYYTPREIVSFIWDRVGYNNPKSYFWYINGKRIPKFVFDPASGSGGFLVEAARRIRDESKLNWNEFNDLLDVRTGILAYLFGSEISPFPYYLTEINLLVQLTPVIRRMLELQSKFKSTAYPLSVVNVDSLSLYNLELSLIPDETKEYKVNNTNKILSLDSQKKSVYRNIKGRFTGKFSYVCANPPYVGEKGHKELFRYTLRSYPYWKKYYQGKMDYLYWFIILGISKLREWGKLGFITSAYWPTADGASKLRKYILQNAKIKEMIFFEEVKIFEHAKGQHNMVFVLTKCSGEDKKKERENNHIKIVQVKCKNQDLPGDNIRKDLDFLTEHIQKYINKPRYEDKYIKIFWSGVRQGELPKDGGAWNVRTPSNIESVLKQMVKVGIPLINIVNINSGADVTISCLTLAYSRVLPAQDAQKFGLQIGDGIFVLNESELQKLNLSTSEATIVKPFIKNSGIVKYIIDQTEKKYLIYLDWDSKLNEYPKIKQHLEKFRPIMEDQISRYEETYPWWALHRPRKQEIFEGVKIVNPQHAQEPFFAYSDEPLYASRDVYYITQLKHIKESIFYLLVILNSKLVRIWLTFKGKKKGNVFELKTTPLSKIPIHRINFDDPEEVKMHDEIVDMVKTIREKMAELAKYSKYFYGIRLTKIEFNSSLPKVNDEAIIKSIPSRNVYNIRTHPELKIEKPRGFEEEKFYLNKVEKPELILTGNAQLKLKGKDKTSVFIEGPYELLKLIFDILPNWKGKQWSEIKENLLVPNNIKNCNVHKNKILNEVRNIRIEIQSLQKQIDQIVYKLYELKETEIKIVEG